MLVRKIEEAVNKEIPRLSSQLEQNVQENSSFYGFKEYEDISVLLQQIVNNKNINYLKFKNGTYKLSELINIERDDLVLDFNNSTIIWESYKDINNIHRDKSIINIKGKNIGAGQPIIDINPNNEEFTRLTIKVVNGDDFKVGDFVRLYLHCGDYHKDRINPIIDVMTKIVYKNENEIALDYKNPYKFTFADIVESSITKIQPIKNVDIYNINIIDKTDINNPLSSLNKYVSGVIFNKAYNCKCKNFKIENHKLIGIVVSNSNNITLKNIGGFNAQLQDDGHGYCVQSGGSMKLVYENIYGHNVRHINDFTNCSYAVLKDCYNLGTTSSLTYSCHGQYDHDILYENVIGGSFSINHGEVFGNMVANISFVNCKGAWFGGESQSTKFINCDMYIAGHFHQNTKIENSRITFPLCYANLNKPKRGIGSSLILINCELIPELETSKILGICDYDIVKFYTCTLKSNFLIELLFRNSKKIYMDKVDLKNVQLSLQKDNAVIGDEFNLKITNSDIINDIYSYENMNQIVFKNSNTLKYNIKLLNNSFINLNENVIVPFRTSPSSSAFYEFILNGNIFKGRMTQDLNANNGNITSVFIGNYYNTSSKPVGAITNFDMFNIYKQYM